MREQSFLIDYLNAEPAAREFLEENETKPFFTPTLALFEAYRGGARTTGWDGVETISRPRE